MSNINWWMYPDTGEWSFDHLTEEQIIHFLRHHDAARVDILTADHDTAREYAAILDEILPVWHYSAEDVVNMSDDPRVALSMVSGIMGRTDL